MSRMVHHAVIVTVAGYAWDDVLARRVEEFRESLPQRYRPLFSGPAESPVNGYRSFSMLTDGSKEGWDEDEYGERLRDRLTAVFDFVYDDGSSPYDIVIVEYGKRPDVQEIQAWDPRTV